MGCGTYCTRSAPFGHPLSIHPSEGGTSPTPKHVFNTDFRYVREVVQGNNAVLEFECMMDNIAINGVDMLTMDEDVITDFKVMVRPLKAVNKVHEKMMAMLEQMHPSAK